MNDINNADGTVSEFKLRPYQEEARKQVLAYAQANPNILIEYPARSSRRPMTALDDFLVLGKGLHIRPRVYWLEALYSSLHWAYDEKDSAWHRLNSVRRQINVSKRNWIATRIYSRMLWVANQPKMAHIFTALKIYPEA